MLPCLTLIGTSGINEVVRVLSPCCGGLTASALREDRFLVYIVSNEGIGTGKRIGKEVHSVPGDSSQL